MYGCFGLGTAADVKLLSYSSLRSASGRESHIFSSFSVGEVLYFGLVSSFASVLG
jgi:hypothetical protein